MRTFAVSSRALDRCPIRSMLASHFRDDGSCYCEERPMANEPLAEPHPFDPYSEEAPEHCAACGQLYGAPIHTGTPSRFYETDPDDPEAPVVLAAWEHPTGLTLRPGQAVRYVNSGAPTLDGPLVLTEILRFECDLGADGIDRGARSAEHVVAVLNDGEYEVDAVNLIPEPEETNR